MSDRADIEAFIRVYRLFSEAAGMSDEFDLELAIIDAMINDFENAIAYAESDKQVITAKAAIEAARALKRATMAVVAAPGANGSEEPTS